VVQEFGEKMWGGKFTAKQPLKYRAEFPSVKSKKSTHPAEKRIAQIIFSDKSGQLANRNILVPDG
jgi:hypothetical protein